VPEPAEDAGPIDLDLLSGREDPLTAVVFGRLRYLPAEVAWSLLSASCDPLGASERLPGAPPPGDPAWKLWASVPPAKGSKNSLRVEPDVLVTWDDTVLIVEAKHHGDQGSEQWLDQIRAVRAHGEWNRPTLRFVAVGGRREDLDTARVEKVRDVLGEDAPPLYRTSWRRLGKAVGVKLDAGNQPAHVRAVLADIAAGLDLWGYRPRTRMETLPEAIRPHVGRDFERVAATLRAWRLR